LKTDFTNKYFSTLSILCGNPEHKYNKYSEGGKKHRKMHTFNQQTVGDLQKYF